MQQSLLSQSLFSTVNNEIRGWDVQTIRNLDTDMNNCVSHVPSKRHHQMHVLARSLIRQNKWKHVWRRALVIPLFRLKFVELICVLFLLSGPNRGHYIAIVKSHDFWLLFDDDIVEVSEFIFLLLCLHSKIDTSFFFYRVPVFLTLLCCFSVVENRRTGHRRILRSHFWNLQELWVGLHPLLPVQRLNSERAFHHRNQKCSVPSVQGAVDHNYTTAACLPAQLLFIPVLLHTQRCSSAVEVVPSVSPVPLPFIPFTLAGRCCCRDNETIMNETVQIVFKDIEWGLYRCWLVVIVFALGVGWMGI